jgi:hypothetical protein
MKSKIKKNEKEKSCLICKRIIDTDSKVTVCPTCVNTYGTLATLTGIALFAFLVKKYGVQIAKALYNAIRLIK